MMLTASVLACDLGWFRLLAETEKPLTTARLAYLTKCDEEFLGRVLRFLASHRLVKEVDLSTFTANDATRALSSSDAAATMRHSLDLVMPCLQILPQYIASTQHCNPSYVNYSLLQYAQGIAKASTPWSLTQPDTLANANLWIAMLHDCGSLFLDVFNLDALCQLSTPGTVAFVDVGGGKGEQCARLRERVPYLKGRIVLQDLPEALATALSTPGVELMEVDFWNEQPVKGALVYYIRNILHEHNDEDCVHLLRTIIPALGPGSIILIDEMIMPELGAHWRAAQMDMMLMATMASKERTARQWYALLDAAGLKISKCIRYSGDASMCLTAATPKMPVASHSDRHNSE
ncbi:MAG: hypothetical protein Q9165_008046 [Trypethelium subeluteriae]